MDFQLKELAMRGLDCVFALSLMKPNNQLASESSRRNAYVSSL